MIYLQLQRKKDIWKGRYIAAFSWVLFCGRTALWCVLCLVTCSSFLVNPARAEALQNPQEQGNARIISVKVIFSRHPELRGKPFSQYHNLLGWQGAERRQCEVYL